MKLIFKVLISLFFLPVLAFGSVNIFSDTFDRPASNDIDAGSPAGMSGLASPVSYIEHGDIDIAYNDGLSNIENNALHLADGPNMSTLYLNHNFINAEFASSKGMSISLDIVTNDGGATDTDRYIGFGVGNTLAECSNSYFDYNGDGFRGRVGVFKGTSDIWIGWSPYNGGTIQVFKNGSSSTGGQHYDLVNGISLSGNDKLELQLGFNSFNAGQTVNALILWNDVVLGSDSFTWDNTNNNYIGITCRQNDRGFTIDNFNILTLDNGLEPALASFLTDPRYVNSSITSKPVTLSWEALAIPDGATYSITADKAVAFPNNDPTGVATNGPASATAVIDASLGNVEFTLSILAEDSTVLTSSTAVVKTFNPPDPSTPNFIVILTDDQGWGTTSVQIDPEVPESKSDFFETPNLERLANNGIRFTQAYSSHPNCSPSRAALLTGRSPAALHFTDIVDRNTGNLYEGNPMTPPTHINNLPADEMTIPELLKAHNPQYRAAHFGKWHLNGGGPDNHGFDASDGNTGNGRGDGTPPDDPKLVFSITDRAIDWIMDQVVEGKPFYLQVSHYATHLSIIYRAETKAYFDSKTPGQRHQHTGYASMLFDMDVAIGRLIDKLVELKLYENTYVIYTADNGTYPMDIPANINGPIRGWKATAWEGGVRVPFIVTGPGIGHNIISREPIVGYDILPTICDLAGINTAALPSVVEGGSFAGILKGTGSTVTRPADKLVFHWPHYQHAKFSTPDTTMIKDGFKLHYRWESRKTQLFDLNSDLGENNDLARTHYQLANAMKQELMLHLADIGARLPEPNPEYSAICWQPSDQYPPNDFMGRDPLPGDLNQDCMTGIDDLSILVSGWLQQSAPDNEIIDLNKLSDISFDWLKDSKIPVTSDN